MLSKTTSQVNKGPLFIDLETYYSVDYSLSNMTMEGYVRDPRFKFHMLGYNNGGARGSTLVVPASEIYDTLIALDYPNRAVAAHNAVFDLMCIKHHFGLTPKICLDTLGMSRWHYGRRRRRHNLDAAIEALTGFAPKSHAIQSAKGVYDLDSDLYQQLASYCKSDVDKLVGLFRHLVPHTSKYAFDLIDWSIRCYLEPVLQLDTNLLASASALEKTRREEILSRNNISASILRSRPKFAQALIDLGIPESELPMKRNAKGESTYAFAKNDEGFIQLLESPNPTIAAIAHAKMEIGSSIYPTRLERLRDISTRGSWPVGLNFCGAQVTARFSGGDRVNPQNLSKGSVLREAVHAPPGHKLVVIDSSNIETRVLAWLANDSVLKNQFNHNLDPYKTMAAQIYQVPIEEITKAQRTVGKVAVLSCGYGAGTNRFIYIANVLWNLGVAEDILRRAHRTYRLMFRDVPVFWNHSCDRALRALMGKSKYHLHDQLYVNHNDSCIELLGVGFKIKYPNLANTPDGLVYGPPGVAYNIYGAKVTENLCQSLAGAIVGEQLRILRRKYTCALQVHDELVFVVPEAQASSCLAEGITIMSEAPTWWPEIKLGAEGHIVDRYSEAK